MAVAAQEQHPVTAKPAIRMAGIEKRFDNGSMGLHDITLDIRERELLVLLGPSGCGKSTTLNILAGLEAPTSGEVRFGDRLMNDVPPEDRDVSMVFQSMTLYPHLNVRQNIEFALRHRRVPRATIDERVATISSMLGIEEYLGRRIHQLSGGQRQRVAIAKALVKRPSLFLLDEPFTALDADLRRQMRSELVRLHRELETTMLFVTHDQEEAMSVADRIAVLDEGRLVQVGSPLDVYFAPANLWAARFVGSHPINLLDVEADAAPRLRLPDRGGLLVDVPAPIYSAVARQGGGQAVLGLRPELVELTGPGGTGLPGEIFTRQVLGGSILYEVTVGTGSRLRAVAGSAASIDVGAPVTAQFQWDRCLVFDKATGERMDIG